MADIQDLDTFVMPGDQEREHYRVVDERHATSLVRRLRRTTSDLAEIESMAAEEHARIDRWVADRAAGAKHDIQWLRGQLEGFMRALIEADPRGPKTLPLIGAQVKATQTGGLKSVVIADPAAYLPWALDHDMLDWQAPITLPYQMLLHVETMLRRFGNGEHELGFVVDKGLALSLAEQVAEAAFAQAKVLIPKGLRPLDAEALRKGDQPAVDPNTGEVVPGLAVTQVGYNVKVILEES